MIAAEYPVLEHYDVLLSRFPESAIAERADTDLILLARYDYLPPTNWAFHPAMPGARIGQGFRDQLPIKVLDVLSDLFLFHHFTHDFFSLKINTRTIIAKINQASAHSGCCDLSDQNQR